MTSSVNEYQQKHLESSVKKSWRMMARASISVIENRFFEGAARENTWYNRLISMLSNYSGGDTIAHYKGQSTT